jgi:hypothetical protein
MFKQTFSSEWRKQRWVLCAAVVIAILYELVFDIGWVAQKKADFDTPFILFSFFWFWPIAGSVAGALIFVEGPNRSCDSPSKGFSFSILLLKLSLGISAAFVSTTIAIFAAVFGFRNWEFGVFGDESSSSIFHSHDLVPEKVLAGLLLAFAISILFSAVSRRMFTSAVSSLAITSLLFFSTSALWRKLVWEKPLWMIVNIAVAAIIVLVISFRIAIRNNYRSRSIRGILPAAILISLVTIAVYGCLTYIYLRTELKLPQLVKVSPTGRNVLVTAANYQGMRMQLWVLPVNQKQEKHVVRRNAYLGNYSPDGNWIIYFSQQNWLGLVSDFIGLRTCRTDGSDDRMLIPDFAKWDPNGDMFYSLRNAISTDNIRVALSYGSDLYVASLDRHTVQKVRLSSEYGGGDAIGFHSNGVEVLLSSAKGLIACNPIDGKCRVLLESGRLRKAWYWGCFSTRRNESAVRQILFGFQLFDIESSTTQLLSNRGNDGENPGWWMRADFSPDQRTLVYAVNSPNLANRASRIHIYAIETGADDLISAFPDLARNVFFSPSGNSIAIALISPNTQIVSVQSKKPIRSFAGWEAVGWASENEVILKKEVGEGNDGVTDSAAYSVLMAAGDIATGNIRQFYP